MNKSDKNIERKAFDEYISAISIEIEQAQVKLVSAANIQMLLHYWKIGYFILFNQKQLGWGSKFIKQTSDALRKLHPEKKGYSPRNLTYMCQFAKLYPMGAIEQLIKVDQELEKPTLEKVLSMTEFLNGFQFTQEAPAQIEDVGKALVTITQHPITQIENCFICSPVSKINWASLSGPYQNEIKTGFNRRFFIADTQK
jgi:hypothetical protein